MLHCLVKLLFVATPSAITAILYLRLFLILLVETPIKYQRDKYIIFVPIVGFKCSVLLLTGGAPCEQRPNCIRWWFHRPTGLL